MKPIFSSPSNISPKLPIIIGGFYRSGTSLVRRILDAHSQIHCGPEVKFFKDFYGDYLHDELRHVRFFETLPSLGITLDELLPIFGDAFIRSHEFAMQKSGKARWADKNPENVLYLERWRQLIPRGFFFVYVERNPLDALASLKEIGFQKTVPLNFSDKLQLYLKFHYAAQAYFDTFPKNCIRIRYEELVTNPEQVLASLFMILGERYEPSVLFDCFSNERGTGIEDPKVGQTRSIHCRNIGRWQVDLDDSELLLAKEILGVLPNSSDYWPQN